jgi:RHS repeat-associated protein
MAKTCCWIATPVLAVTTSYLNGVGIDNHLRQTSTTTVVSYFLTDHLGTTTALTDGSGTVVETLSYDSFGNNAGSTRTRYTYTGRERDADTSLLYYRARFYDPQVGRFISEDPIGLAEELIFWVRGERSCGILRSQRPLSAAAPSEKHRVPSCALYAFLWLVCSLERRRQWHYPARG